MESMLGTVVETEEVAGHLVILLLSLMVEAMGRMEVRIQVHGRVVLGRVLQQKSSGKNLGICTLVEVEHTMLLQVSE